MPVATPMNPTQITYGCLPSSGSVKAVSAADWSRLTYATTTNTGVSGRLQKQEDVWENFKDIHGIGKKDTQYMKFQKSRSPLLDHSAVTSKRDFVAFPLGDHEMNTDLARTFRGNVDSGRGSSAAPFNDQTTYKDTFLRLSPERLREAKLPSTQQKGKRTKTLTSVTDMLETRPRSHIEHAPPVGDLVDKEPVLHKPKPNLGLSGSWGLFPVSSYRHEFSGKPLRKPAA
jgi:hypothetical protein